MRLVQVDAFTAEAFRGNPAAVCVLDAPRDEEWMAAVAREMNLSETAFLERRDGEWGLRWFTPATEVDLCGHATLAAGHVLMSAHQVRFATRSGILTVSRAEDLLELNLPACTVEQGALPGLAEALGVSGATYIASGAEDAAIVLLDDERAVRAVRPDFAALADFPELVIVTAPGDEHSVVSRVFAVPFGIAEDPVTGAAHAALTPFWSGRLGRNHFTALQASQRSGILHCRLEGDRVVLGGQCVTVIAGSFQL